MRSSAIRLRRLRTACSRLLVGSQAQPFLVLPPLCVEHQVGSVETIGAGWVAVVGVVDDGNSRRACQRLAPMFSNGKVCQLFLLSVGDAKGCGYRYCALFVAAAWSLLRSR